MSVYFRDGISCQGSGPAVVVGAEVLSAIVPFLPRQIRRHVLYRKPS